MSGFSTLIDAVLFLFFLLTVVWVPLVNSQLVLPLNYYPEVLVDFKNWYIREFGDYLFAEKPAFFVGLAWLEILFQWPIAVVSLYAMLASKSWFRTTCLIYGVSLSASLAAVMMELRSSKASNKLQMVYLPFVGFAVLAILRGLLPCPSSSSASLNAKRAPQPRKKKA